MGSKIFIYDSDDESLGINENGQYSKNSNSLMAKKYNNNGIKNDNDNNNTLKKKQHIQMKVKDKYASSSDEDEEETFNIMRVSGVYSLHNF